MARSTSAKFSLRHLRRSELPVDTVTLARYLIGKSLMHDLPQRRLAGRIVETEAYTLNDEACHAFRGPTPANRSLFLRHGHAYLRFTYGSCWLMNVSSEAEGSGAGVLIRALEPFEGIEWMLRRRKVTRAVDIARGPGRLADALQLDKRFDGVDLCARSSPLWLGSAVRAVDAIAVSPRIGISRAVEHPLRFYERGNPFVSGSVKLRL